MVGLASIAQAFNPINDEKRSDALLMSLSETDDASLGDFVRFQYFPETVQDTKKNNWQSKEIPGASLPVKQWISGGDRTIAFTAVFTCDVDLLATSPLEKRITQLAALGQQDRNIDIRAAIVWLRRHMLPIYGQTSQATAGVVTTFAPRKVRLYMANSGIGLYGGMSHSTSPDSIVAVMTQCDVGLETFFKSGLPRLAVVSLSFDQVGQYQGYTEFPSVTPDLDSLVPGAQRATNPGTSIPQPSGPGSTHGVVPYTLAARARVNPGS